MARALRPRKARPSYANLIDSDNEAAHDDGEASSDDFQPPEDQEDNEDDAALDEADGETLQGEGALVDEDNDISIVEEVSKSTKVRKAKQPGKQKSMPAKSPRPSAALARPTSRPQHVISTSALDHRQRADPLYLRPSLIERLTQPPSPFKPPVTRSTLSWNFNKLNAEKYMKASGYNVGRGPIWELLEDRSWWKESETVNKDDTETETTRRTRVYESVKINDGDLESISEQEARKYLPGGADSFNEFSKVSIKCSFGKPGKSVHKEIDMLDSFEIEDDAFGQKALVFFAGGPVWGLDWCPSYSQDRSHRHHKQYLAVAPLPSNVHAPLIGRKCRRPFPSCIQIWSHSPRRSDSSSEMNGQSSEADDDFGQTKCELVLCLDCGPAHEIKWCPLPSHDSWSNSSPSGKRKLGLLAGTFEDGSLSIFVVPDPDDLSSGLEERPKFVKIQPVIQLELEETCMWSLDWANSERIAVGCTNGSIAVYNIHEALVKDSTRDSEILPTHYLSIHQSAVRSIKWIPIPSAAADGSLKFTHSPTKIASGGYDGCEIVTDLRDGWGCILNRTRDVVLAMTYSNFTEGVVTIDLDYSVKTYAMAPGILGRGNIVIESGGPVWSLHASDYHPLLALGSADGSLLTTNMLRATRRSPTTPFLYYKIYQIDYSRNGGEYRMLDHFLPQEIPDKSSTSVSKKGKKEATAEAVPPRTGAQGAGAWSPEVSVTRVAWNNGGGLARAPLLASATASGLCRIDWLLGHFQDGELPYRGAQESRNEVNTEDKMEEDVDY
ncbi:uncharacterized protein FOMMEDRAFT_104009 [Fomitiporia mediterranea MF3/22]|uniref:uncharacterized protein n=1 Tax=Fomitiporia mediterranea (strain MF3/22) TaxID=694068 RepID=UPI0004407E26|nr:uncharacterized protein FOMMEDRAFT_104009 [Fomitiporia mediterranea MF3/22]EJD05772.1 hypothetical protein FOMMEDRAFT_104009 [Fomitiporia mediterranea MF3/22]